LSEALEHNDSLPNIKDGKDKVYIILDSTRPPSKTIKLQYDFLDEALDFPLFPRKTNIFSKKEKPKPRFMPNVKFRGSIETEVFLNTCEAVNFSVARRGYIDGWCTSYDGKSILSLTEAAYLDQTHMKEVSVYEAIPELVPKGMVYDPTSSDVSR
jgi:hypothetical protein